MAAALVLGACVGAGNNYGARGHYEHPEPTPTPTPTPMLVSAQVQRFGQPPPPLGEATAARMVAASEADDDRVLLVFARELDPVTVDPRSFAILRGDGRRVRATRAFLAPADEGDENRSLTLTGNFGEPDSPPVAVHVIGSLYAETGEDLRGLDAEIIGPEQADRAVVVERLTADANRCPGAAQVVRAYFSDTLTGVGAEDLARVELRLADGRMVTATGFDDQAARTEDEPCPAPFTACLGPVDDNVLDICVDAEVAVVHLRIPAGTFSDPAGTPSATVDVALPR